MNELNHWETHLRSWAPRRPSARLERRLFACQHAPIIAEDRSPLAGQRSRLHLRWLAPATAALVMLFVLYGQHNDGSAARSNNSGPFMAMIMSNHSVAAYFPANFQRDQNGPPADTFEWTNGSGSTSSIRSLLTPKAQN